MSENTNNTEHYDQAFELVFALHDESDVVLVAEINAQISQFKTLSAAHNTAIEKAEIEWILMGAVEPKPLNIKQKVSLFMQQKIASFVDKPQQLLPIAAILLVVLLLPLVGGVGESEPNLDAAYIQTETVHYETAYGQLSELILSDGSVLSLNWNTQLQVTFSANKRSVLLLKGEALFSVAKDPNRPFIVSVGGVQALAVGTQFSVQKLDDNHADIAVTEGVVEVTVAAPNINSLAPKVQLQANQAVIASSQRLSAITHFSSAEISAWREGMMVFNGRPLGAVLAELNRYTPYKIDVDPLLDIDEAVTATYFVDQADEALASLAQLFSLQTKIQKNGGSTTLVISPGKVVRPIY